MNYMWMILFVIGWMLGAFTTWNFQKYYYYDKWWKKGYKEGKIDQESLDHIAHHIDPIDALHLQANVLDARGEKDGALWFDRAAVFLRKQLGQKIDD